MPCQSCLGSRRPSIQYIQEYQAQNEGGQELAGEFVAGFFFSSIFVYMVKRWDDARDKRDLPHLVEWKFPVLSGVAGMKEGAMQ